uniref:Methyltransferase-like 27 n=4 Tax=Danio rerio TaxID=7955 RepID=F1QE45_DANRE|nr:Williams-Beuren syndrome chromosomal region 27 protein isoform X1 [Danio rerio]|eukprot:XP_021324579.1 Williams-Beuren syndrome chromosomal region 27 protein isoform X1 [Danio rerio]
MNEVSHRMANTSRTFSDVRNVILSAHKNTEAQDKVGFYDTWADNYEQDVAVLDYRAPLLAAECVSSFFNDDREKATVLDVACGTGLVSKHLKRMGFRHFDGVDGSLRMLEGAKKTGLYKQLMHCMLGQDRIPVKAETYDVVIIVGALSVGQVPLKVIRELWDATKPGGYVCMTTRANTDNQKYKAELEQMIKALEEEQKWRSVAVVEVEEWERGVSELDTGYIPGAVYLYQKGFL